MYTLRGPKFPWGFRFLTCTIPSGFVSTFLTIIQWNAAITFIGKRQTHAQLIIFYCKCLKVGHVQVCRRRSRLINLRDWWVGKFGCFETCHWQGQIVNWAWDFRAPEIWYGGWPYNYCKLQFWGQVACFGGETIGKYDNRGECLEGQAGIRCGVRPASRRGA